MEFVIEGILTLTLVIYIASPLLMRDRWQTLTEQNEESHEM